MSLRRHPFALATLPALLCLVLLQPARADENLFGYVKGAETLPEGASELYLFVTHRSDKDTGRYRATDYQVEYEHGITNRFTASAALKAMTLDTSGLLINGYLPEDKKFGFKVSGLEVAGKYNFLSPAKDDIGLATEWAFNLGWIDRHSGQVKHTGNFEFNGLLQKYFLEGQLNWVANAGVEATYAKRKPVANLPDDFEWPTKTEIELELKAGTGLSYRFAPNWYAGAELLYETEFETEVGQERWTVFGGPNIHYGGDKWWVTLTWLPQLRGGGEVYDGQPDTRYHLIEKTRQEVRLKVGYNF